MSWKNLKTFAIGILLVMNAVFLFLIWQREYRSTHYDGELVNSAVSVLKQSELYIDPSLLSGKIETYPVYAGEMEEGKVHVIVEAIADMGYVITEEPGGVRCKDAIGEFYFADDFGFYYLENGRYDRPSTLLRSERYILLTEDRSYKESALRVVESFLKKYQFLSDENERYGYEISYSEVYSSGVNYIVTLSQSVNGVPLHEGIAVQVSGGRVVGADGVFVTEPTLRSETAESVDLLEMLFSEKAYLDEVFLAGGSFSRMPMVVTGIEYSYAVYFEEGKQFYLVPLCEIRYANGEKRVYNCVSGKLYA